jgi:hypothetical protein
VLHGGGSRAALRAHLRRDKLDATVVEAGDAARILAELE